MPKAELHIHLEGTIRPETLLGLARRNGVDLPAQTPAGVRAWLTRHRDFGSFCDVSMHAASCLKTAEDYELITRDFGAQMHAQNVRYAEVTVSPCMHRFAMGVRHDTYFAGLTSGRRHVYEEFGITINWVFDIVRELGDPAERRRRAEYTTSVAIDGIHYNLGVAFLTRKHDTEHRSVPRTGRGAAYGVTEDASWSFTPSCSAPGAAHLGQASQARSPAGHAQAPPGARLSAARSRLSRTGAGGSARCSGAMSAGSAAGGQNR